MCQKKRMWAHVTSLKTWQDTYIVSRIGWMYTISIPVVQKMMWRLWFQYDVSKSQWPFGLFLSQVRGLKAHCCCEESLYKFRNLSLQWKIQMLCSKCSVNTCVINPQSWTTTQYRNIHTFVTIWITVREI